MNRAYHQEHNAYLLLIGKGLRKNFQALRFRSEYTSTQLCPKNLFQAPLCTH